MAEPNDEVFDAIAEVLPPCLDTLERIAWVQRHLYPPVAARLAVRVGRRDQRERSAHEIR